MGGENEFCCEAVRKRHANNSVSGSGGEGQQQGRRRKINGLTSSYRDDLKTALAREKKINKTKVSFFDFWYECIDWDMIKLFYALMMLFFCTVGFTCMIYLLYVFNYNEKLWYYYFPVRDELKIWKLEYLKSVLLFNKILTAKYEGFYVEV